MTSPWPFDRLVITGSQLALRPVRDQDLPALLAVFPDDFDLDPGYPPMPDLAPAADRERRLIQSIWRHRGCWTPDEWALDFGVWRDAEPVGIQTLEGTSFRADRTVDSASWIAKPRRGNGFGRHARAAVLAFAFECLGATTAITSAVTTNQASLAVSRRLGYRDASIRPHDTGHGIVDLQHLTLTAVDWSDAGSHYPVEITGFEACRPFFVRS
ncbi:GNAT family N-acetyltransferase [Flexivirga caeni]|uniref:N-acetyltransferase n=1 Tax=Flexivirga caeni TaxID=2294115 RepID=A0A3M9M859_9MICO|nr:GNAT family N-acetyltransferase [Flexivirga caeni]RNI21666.1 N-acetyltransferase [Flexivirga caeni]